MASIGGGRLFQLVERALMRFLQEHAPSADVQCLDGIVLSYIVGIVEEIVSDEDVFDVFSFMETVAAYIPHFDRIESDTVRSWMINLAAVVNSQQSSDVDETQTPASNIVSHGVDKQVSPSPSPSRASHCNEHTAPALRECRVDSTNDISADFQETLLLLSEVFPDTGRAELLQCVSTACGDKERAIQLVLSRRETGQAIETSISQEALRRRIDKIGLDDKSLKEQIIAKYSYQDVEDAHRKHKPQPPKSSPRKMVRYLDSKVVSVKGERFTEIKREECDELKKTFVNLKAQKQYRFH